MVQRKLSSDLLRGHVDTMILKLLQSGDKYGYEISKLIYVSSNEQYEIKEATMYSSLKRLEKDECIISYWGDATQGGRRKYYKITAIGEDTYTQNKNNWEQAKQILERLL
ncbi:PadR family transcriptional regulator [Peribacillus butanolivorans]|uniref:PadR family transcriptional regulator n=1 Tax=Peribacillus TaxID=2675229 RepID=UPI001911E38A|nr:MULTISPECIES: PadR family transcriptional regulator [unclassified Peribacillus]MBK5443513.1 PadR family transcriptional regulator [Peribacillus sp. TH24]MBK5461756.1 PadR family transcriptional regulator [Peribacillus sp. TH27]MBK5484920.1 PadR family transcriptional regulator [Peribacillus sp. TH16]MBK5499902.1 PadR family transcriptional regulator [Peribacillus sp. TH14]WMX59014.1 PadR family transcriptional regulator [Peribacillus sp. R9-11]